MTNKTNNLLNINSTEIIESNESNENFVQNSTINSTSITNGNQIGNFETNNKTGGIIIEEGENGNIIIAPKGGGIVQISGNLSVTGITNTVNSTSTNINNPIMEIGEDTTNDPFNRGIKFKYNNGLSKIGFIGYDNNESKFLFIPDAYDNAGKFTGNPGTIKANLEGTITIPNDGTIGSLGYSNAISINSIGGIKLYGNISSNNINNGTLVIQGGIGVSENINIGGDIGFFNENLNLKAVKQSTSTNVILPDLQGNDGDIVIDNLKQSLTNKTLIKPKINNGDSITDISGNNILIFNSIPNAVNELLISNSADKSGPIISSNSNKNKDIDLNLQAKGSGNINLITNNNRTLSFNLDKSLENVNTTFIINSTENRTITFPNNSDTLVGINTIDCLSNKTLTTPIINSPFINGTIKLNNNKSSSISFDSGNKIGIFKIDTTDKLEKVTISSNLEVYGSTTFINDVISNGNIIPAIPCKSSLGCENFEWSDLFLAYTGIIYFGDNKEVSLAHIPEIGLVLNEDSQLQFGSSKTYINQSKENELNIVGNTISINGNTIFNNKITIVGDIIPEKSNISSLGNEACEWKDLYLAESSEIKFGNNQKVKIIHLPNNGVNISSITNLKNKSTDLLKLTHITNDTPEKGSGVSISFTLGNDKQLYKAMNLETIATNNINESEDFDFVIKLMENGKENSERMRLTSSGNLILSEDGSVITMGQSGSISLTQSSNQLLLNNNSKLAFGNSKNYIQQTEDNNINLNSENINLNVGLEGVSINGDSPKITIGSKDSKNPMLLLNDNDIKFRSGINSDTNEFEFGLGHVKGVSNSITINSNQEVKIISNMESSNYTSGSLVVDGGVGIAKNLNLGGNIIIPDLGSIGSKSFSKAINISNTGLVNIISLSLNGNIILASSDEINQIHEIVPGIASSNKAIILNQDKSIEGISKIESNQIISTGSSIFNQIDVDKSININNIASINAEKNGNLEINTKNDINITAKRKNLISGNEVNIDSKSTVVLKNNGITYGSFTNNNGNLSIATNSSNSPSILFSNNNTILTGKLIIPDYGTIGSTSSNSAITISDCGVVSITTFKSNLIKLLNGGKIIDNYNNELLKFNQTKLAINELTIHNSSSGVGPTIQSTGEDKNIDLNLQSKGTGVFNLLTNKNKKLTIDFDKNSVNSNTTLLINSNSDSNSIITLPESTTELVGNDTKQSLYNKTLVNPIFTNESYISDINGKELIQFTNDSSAVNYLSISNSSINKSPSLKANGIDKDVDLNLSGKGNGIVKINNSEIVTMNSNIKILNKTLIAPKFDNNGFIADINGNRLLTFETNNIKSTNNLKISNNTKGLSPSISAIGVTDEDIDIDLIPKGKGQVKINGSPIIAATDSSTITLTNKTFDNPKIIGTLILQEASIEIKNGKNSSGFISFYENSINGKRCIKLKAPENINKNYTVTLPEGNTTLVSMDSTQTIINKTFVSPKIEGTLSIKNYDNDKAKIDFYPDSKNKNNKVTLSTPSNILSSYIVTLPCKNDTLVGLSTVDILKNKTIIRPIINQITTNSQNIIDIPDSTDTLVARTTVDSLSNKTLITPKFKNKDYISDINGSKYIVFSETKKAVNELTISNSDSKVAPKISSSGKDNNIDLTLEAKGSGNIKLLSNTNKSLTIDLENSYKNSNTIFKINSTVNRIISFPDNTDTLIGQNTAQTITNKKMISTDLQGSTSISNGTISAGYLDFFENSLNGTNVITLSAPENINKDHTLILPSEDTTLVGLTTKDTLTNKTLNLPVINSAILTGIITVCNDLNSVVSFDSISQEGILKIVSDKNLEKVSVSGSFEISNKKSNDIPDLLLTNDNSKLTMGTTNPVSIIHSENQLLINKNNKIAFGTSNKYIHQSSDSQFSIVSDGKIKLKNNNKNSEIILENNDNIFGSFSNKDGNLIIKSGDKLATAITCCGKDVKIEGSLIINNKKFCKEDIFPIDNVIPGIACANKAIILDESSSISNIKSIYSGPIVSSGKSSFQHMTINNIILEDKSIKINNLNKSTAIIDFDNSGTLNINTEDTNSNISMKSTGEINLSSVKNISMKSTGEINLSSVKNISLETNNGEIILKDKETNFGSFLNNNGNILIKSGNSKIATFDKKNLTINGNIKCESNIIIDDTLITESDIKKLNEIKNGIASPNKALVVDNLSNISKIGNIASGPIKSTGYSKFEQMEIGNILLNDTSIKFKKKSKDIANLNVNDNGTLDIVTICNNKSKSDININAYGSNSISGSQVKIHSMEDIILESNNSNILLKNNKEIFGSLTSINGNMVIKSGSSEKIAIKCSGSNITLGGTLTIGSNTINESEFSVLNKVNKGTAMPEKALILDSDGNIKGIGEIQSGNIISTGTSSFSNGITPASKAGASIGNKKLGWNDVYLSEESNIYLGDNQNVSIKHINNNGIQLSSLTNNKDSTSEILDIKHKTTEIPKTGIGSNIGFTVQTNKHFSKKGMILETVTTDVTNKKENFDFIVKLMENGLIAEEKFRVSSSGLTTSESGFTSTNGPIKATFNSTSPVCTLIGGKYTDKNPILKLENSELDIPSDVTINFKSLDKSFTLGFDSANDVFALSSSNNLNSNIFSINPSGNVKATSFSGLINGNDISSGTVSAKYMDGYQTEIKSILSENIKIGTSDKTKIDFDKDDTISFFTNKSRKMILDKNSLSPGSNNLTSLGNSLIKWSNLFLSTNSKIVLGNNNDVTLTHVPNKGILLNDSKQLQFANSKSYISGTIDNTLNIVSEENINIKSNSIVLDSKNSEIVLKENGINFGKFTNSCGELVIKSSSSNITAITCTGENVNIAGSLTIGGIELNPIVIQSLDNIIPGKAISGKMVVLDENKNITEINKISCNEIKSTGKSFFGDEINPINSGKASIGSISNRWSGMYLDDYSSIYMGSQQTVSIKHLPKSGLILSSKVDDNNEIKELLNLNQIYSNKDIDKIETKLAFSIQNLNGLIKKGMILESETSNDNNNNFDFIVKLMKDGNKASEKFRLNSDGELNLVQDNSKLKFGTNGSVSISHSKNQLLINDDNKLAFGNSKTFIKKSNENNFELVSDKNIQIESGKDIILDSNNSIKLKNNGFEYGSFYVKNNNIVIKSGNSTSVTFNKDNMIISGNIKCKNINSNGNSTFEKIKIGNIIIDDKSIILNGNNDTKSTISLNDESSININSNNNINLESSGSITLDTNKSEIILSDKGKRFGKFTGNEGKLVIKSGLSDTISIICSGDNINIPGKLSIYSEMTLGKTLLKENDVNKINNIKNGIATQNKAIILDYNKNISEVGIIECKSVKASGISNFDKIQIDKIQISNQSIIIKGENDKYSSIYLDETENLNISNLDNTNTKDININSNSSIKLNSKKDIILDTYDSEIILKNKGIVYGSFKNYNENLVIKSGKNTVATFTDLDIKLYGKVECGPINSNGISTIDNINSKSISFFKTNKNNTELSVNSQGELNITNKNISEANINMLADGLIQLNSKNNISLDSLNGNINMFADGLIELNSKNDINLDSLNGNINFKSNGKTFAKLTNENGNINIKSETINYATFTDSKLKINGSFDCEEITSTGNSSFGDITVNESIKFKSDNKISINNVEDSILLKSKESIFACFTNNNGYLNISSKSTSINLLENNVSINGSLKCLEYININNEILNESDITKLNNITPGIAEPNKILVLDDSKSISEIGSINCGNINSVGNMNIFNSKYDASLTIGLSKSENLKIEVLKNDSYKTAEEIRFSSHTQSSDAEHGKFTFVIDDIQKLEIDDFGLSITDGNLIIPNSGTIGSVKNTSAIKINNNGSLLLNSISDSNEKNNQLLTLTNTLNNDLKLDSESSIVFNLKTIKKSYNTMTLNTVSTNINKGSEKFDYVVKLMENGSDPTEKLRISSSGHLTFGNQYKKESDNEQSTFIINKYIGQIQGEYVMTLQINLIDGISSKSGDIIGFNEQINASLCKCDSKLIGFIYKIEMMCIEKPKGGDSKIDLFASTDSIETGLSIINYKKNISLIDTSDIWDVGKRKISSEELTIKNGLSDYNLYLVAGGKSKQGKYTQGKFIIKLYGANF